MQEKIRITALSAGVYRLEKESQFLGLAKPLGVFRQKGWKPRVGDYVKVEETFSKDIAYQITEILPRKNDFLRPSIANVDLLLLFVSLKNPEADFLLLDKLLLLGTHLKVEMGIVFTKADLLEQEAWFRFQEQVAFYLPRVSFLLIKGKEKARWLEKGEVIQWNSSLLEETYTEVKKRLFEKFHRFTIAMAGASGVGKSTFANDLLGKEKMQTGEVSQKIERGKHTTRSVEIHLATWEEKKLWLVDTPGFSSLSLTEVGVEEEDFELSYVQYKEKAAFCKFDGCRHLCEKDCAVLLQQKDFNFTEKEAHERYVLLRSALMKEQKTTIYLQKNSKKRKKEYGK